MYQQLHDFKFNFSYEVFCRIIACSPKFRTFYVEQAVLDDFKYLFAVRKIFRSPILTVLFAQGLRSQILPIQWSCKFSLCVF